MVKWIKSKHSSFGCTCILTLHKPLIAPSILRLVPFFFLQFSLQHSKLVFSFSCSVPNVLLTCCADNVCRIWSETVKYKPSHHDKQQQSATTKSCTESDIKHKTDGQVKAEEKLNILQRYHLVSMFHFHLAAVINPSSDIALLSMIPTSSIFGRSFQLQWLNNKEVQLTTAVEAIYASLRKNTANNSTDDVTNETDPFLHVDELDGEIEYNEEVDDNNEKTLDRTFDEGILFCIILI